MFHLVRSCETQLLVLVPGQPYSMPPREICEKTGRAILEERPAAGGSRLAGADEAAGRDGSLLPKSRTEKGVRNLKAQGS